MDRNHELRHHSIDFDKTKCTACLACVRACPTEAIRVIRSRAVIDPDRCIDCGRCITACRFHATRVKADSFDCVKNYEYNVALPATPLFGQFRNLGDANIVIEGLLKIGFDDVFEPAIAAEMLSEYHNRPDCRDWKSATSGEIGVSEYPHICSACPATLRLIAMRFPDLIEGVMPEIAPFELAAILARREAASKTGLSPEKIGICYIAPCPAEITRAKNPIGLSKPVVDYVLSTDEVYLRLLKPMTQVENPRNLVRTGRTGLNWARSGGMSAALPENINALGADGIESVISILEDIEDGKMKEAEVVELDCCTQSCFGGCLTVENAYTAKMRMKNIIMSRPVSCCELPEGAENDIIWDKPLDANDAEQFGGDVMDNLRVQLETEKILKTLPGFDCGSCGAPTCRAFSEDVAEGRAELHDCIFNLIQKIRGPDISRENEEDEFLPPPYRKPLD